jgi:hypothetical protein
MFAGGTITNAAIPIEDVLPRRLRERQENHFHGQMRYPFVILRGLIIDPRSLADSKVLPAYTS